MTDIENMEGSTEPVVEQEKVLPQSKVNDLIRQEKEAARLRAQQEYEQQLSEYKNQLEQLQKANTTTAVDGTQQSQSVNVDEIYNQIEKRLREQYLKEQQQIEETQKKQQMEKVASDYYRNLESARENYPDFEAVMGDFNAKNFPELVMLTSQMDNGGHIMYELAKHPEKLANVVTLLERDTDLARKRLQHLGQSMVKNGEAVANYQAAPAPLSRMQSGNGGVNKPEPNSVRDFKNLDFLRG